MQNAGTGIRWKNARVEKQTRNSSVEHMGEHIRAQASKTSSPLSLAQTVRNEAHLTFALRGLREPQSARQPTLTGAFRTVRQLVAAQGASFLGRGG